MANANDGTPDRIDMYRKGKDKMGWNLDWNSDTGWMAVSLFHLEKV